MAAAGTGIVHNICLTDWPISTSQLLACLMPSLNEGMGLMWSPKAQQIVGQSGDSCQARRMHRSLPTTVNSSPEILTKEL